MQVTTRHRIEKSHGRIAVETRGKGFPAASVKTGAGDDQRATLASTDATHSPFWEVPEIVNRLLADFLKALANRIEA